MWNSLSWLQRIVPQNRQYQQDLQDLSQKCHLCKCRGLYYYCEADQLAQLWYLGRNQFSIETLEQQEKEKSKMLQKLEEIPHRNKCTMREIFITKQQQLLYQTFLILKRGERKEEDIFKSSPRFQWKKQKETESFNAIRTAVHHLPDVLCMIIQGYLEFLPRYLFPIQEVVSESILVKEFPIPFKDVESLRVIYTEKIFDEQLNHLPRHAYQLYLDQPTLNRDNTHPHLKRWSSGFWDCERKTAEQTVLYCNSCLLEQPQIIKKGLFLRDRGFGSGNPRSPVNPYTLDPYIFHYDNLALMDTSQSAFLREE